MTTFDPIAFAVIKSGLDTIVVPPGARIEPAAAGSLIATLEPGA